MITLDKQISIVFLDPVGINKAGAYRYEVYLTNLNGDKGTTLFVGNVFLNENQSELNLDITSIVRSYYKTNNLWENLNEDNKISLFVRYTDLETRQYEQRIINKHQ